MSQSFSHPADLIREGVRLHDFDDDKEGAALCFRRAQLAAREMGELDALFEARVLEAE